jgi:hypothetical protein
MLNPVVADVGSDASATSSRIGRMGFGLSPECLSREDYVKGPADCSREGQRSNLLASSHFVSWNRFPIYEKTATYILCRFIRFAGGDFAIGRRLEAFRSREAMTSDGRDSGL